MSEGFLGRWSQRKAQARAGRPAPEPPPAPPAIEAVAPAADRPVPVAGGPAPPPPTLDDVQALTPASDFTPFLARGIAPAVKNAALKKLFADPRFNVTDGLDACFGDYTQPLPLPAARLREMASARCMGLVTEEGAPPPAGEAADGRGAANVAESAHRNELPGSPVPAEGAAPRADHAHADLRLQPDDAAGRESPGGGAA